jgi:hypothetical protein
LELVGPDGIVGVQEAGGRAAVAEYAPQMIGLTLEEGDCPNIGGSCRFSKVRVRVASPVTSMPKPGTERAFID